MDNQEIEIELQNDPIEMDIENSDSVLIYQEVTIKSISVNGVEQEIDENKNVDITVPTKISDLQNDNNTVQDENYVHTDNNFTTTEKTKLANLENYDDTEIKGDITNLENNKANTSDLSTVAISGSYNDLSNKPDLSGFITKEVNNLTNYTLKTNTGSLIDLEINSTTYVVTLRLKDIDGNVISTDTIDLPLESVVVSGRFDNTTKKVILILENGSEVDFSVADLVAGLQTEITSTNKLNADYVDDSNSGNKFVTTSEKQAWDNKLDEEDLTDYVKNTDYATYNKGGTIKTGNGINVYSTGIPYCTELSYSTYINQPGNFFMAKNTLENVIAGKNLETANNKVTNIDENSTNQEYPTAKAVYDYVKQLEDRIKELEEGN